MVETSIYPDYVFNKDYPLLSLAQVKSYIDLNHHLPEIPSEKETIKDGVNLGEMNKLLLKKVEELTLYLIEKDKQIKKLEDFKEKKEVADKNTEARLKSLESKMKLTHQHK